MPRKNLFIVFLMSNHCDNNDWQVTPKFLLILFLIPWFILTVKYFIPTKQSSNNLCLKFLSSLIYVVVHLGNMAAFDMSLPEAVVSPGKGY